MQIFWRRTPFVRWKKQSAECFPRTLGRAQMDKLKVYAGADHPHQAQLPKPYSLDQIAQ
jgi:large subunit ribosomal protein L13